MLGSLGAAWGRPPLGSPGAVLVRLGAVLGRLGAVLSCLEAALGRLRTGLGCFGALFGDLEAVWELFRASEARPPSLRDT